MWGDTTPPRPERQLQDVVVRTLRFCTTTLRKAHEVERHDDKIGGPDLIPTKVVAECALLARCASAIPKPGFALGDLAKTLVTELAEPARPDTLPLALAFDPAGIPEHVFAHVQLTCLGSFDPSIDELLERAWAARASRGLERSTLHEIEATWIKAIWGGDSQPPFTKELVQRSALGRPLDVLRAHPATTYEFTHAVMQISDLGTWRVTLPRPPHDLIDDVEALLAAALHADNYDLAAELLWTWPMLRLPWTEFSAQVFSLLIDVHGRLGFLPGPDFRTEKYASLGLRDAGAYAQRTSYHTTLVLGMLCSTILSADWLPDPEPAWSPEIATDTAYSVTLALQSAWRATDIFALRRALTTAVETDQASGPVVEQALSLLQLVTAAADLHATLTS